MFGPYQVDHEGRTYFGNVSLREFHIFEYDGHLYVVNVGRMAAFPISHRLASLIDRVASTFGGLVPESVMIELRKLELIATDEVGPPESSLEGETADSRPKSEYPITTIALLLAQECNMRCVYCYGDGGSYGGKGMMSEETALRAVDWLIVNSGSAEKLNISFFGGEPLLNFPVMKKTVPYARERAAQRNQQIAFTITTNGSLISDEIISFLKDENIEFLISFDGPPEYQNSRRPFKDGRGSYDQVRANIQRLRAVFPRLTGRATVYGNADPFRIEKGMQQAGFTTCLLAKASPVSSTAAPAGATPNGPEDLMLQRMMAFNRKQTEGYLAAIRGRNIDRDHCIGVPAAMSDMACGRKRYYGCGIGKSVVGISVTGDIYPCHRFVGQEAMRMGHIADLRVEGLNEYHRAVVDRLPECRRCWARYYCGGGCFYHNKAHTGDMHRPQALDCRERRAMIEGLIHVHCRLDEADKEYVKDVLTDVKA